MSLDSSSHPYSREIEKFIIRQPPIGEKDDYDSENSWTHAPVFPRLLIRDPFDMALTRHL